MDKVRFYTDHAKGKSNRMKSKKFDGNFKLNEVATDLFRQKFAQVQRELSENLQTTKSAS